MAVIVALSAGCAAGPTSVPTGPTRPATPLRSPDLALRWMRHPRVGEMLEVIKGTKLRSPR